MSDGLGGVLIVGNREIEITFSSNHKQRDSIIFDDLKFKIDTHGYLIMPNGDKYAEPRTNNPLALHESIVCIIKPLKAPNVRRAFPIENSDESIRHILYEMKLGPYME